MPSSIRNGLLLIKTFWKNLLKAMEDYLRSRTLHIPSLLPKGRRAMVDSILEQKHHQEFLQKFAQESGISLEHVEETFRRYLREIAADMNYLVTPFWDLILTWVFGFLYDGFEIDTRSLDKIRELSSQKTLVFVPNHRSHVDYLLLSYIFYHHRIPLPHVCSGANLSFWPLGSLFRKSGAFFIRRSYEGNRLYAASVQAYLEELIRTRTHIEFFIEGGRSRTGKLLPPRMGILSTIVQAYYNKAAEEILLIPTSLTYDTVIEGKSYLQEQAGAAKKDEDIWDLFRLRKSLKKTRGRVYVNFGDPISIKEFLTGTGPDQKREKVQELAFEVTYGINKSTVVTPSALVATALLTHPGRSLDHQELVKKVDRYLSYLEFKKAPLSQSIVLMKDKALRESAKQYQGNRLLQVYYDDGDSLYWVPEERRSALDYYKNTSIHFFVSLGVLATLLTSRSAEEVPFKAVEEDYLFLRDLWKYEFTFSRRQAPRIHLGKLIGYLEEKGLARFVEPFVRLEKNARGPLAVFASPLKNILEGYVIVARSRADLGERRWDSRDLLKFLLQKGHILYLREEIDRVESINKFVLNNAVWSLRDLGLFAEETEGWGKKKRTFYTARGDWRGLEAKISFTGRSE